MAVRLQSSEPAHSSQHSTTQRSGVVELEHGLVPCVKTRLTWKGPQEQGFVLGRCTSAAEGCHMKVYANLNTLNQPGPHLKGATSSRQQRAPDHAKREGPAATDLPSSSPLRLAIEPRGRPVPSDGGVGPLEVGIKGSYQCILAALLLLQQLPATTAAAGAARVAAFGVCCVTPEQFPAPAVPPGAVRHFGGPHWWGVWD